MEKQTKEQAVKQAVKKCPYKKICKHLKFSEKEKRFILDQIDIQLDSYRSGGSNSKYLNFLGSFTEDMCDIKVMRSIYEKLRDANCVEDVA